MEEPGCLGDWYALFIYSLSSCRTRSTAAGNRKRTHCTRTVALCRLWADRFAFGGKLWGVLPIPWLCDDECRKHDLLSARQKIMICKPCRGRVWIAVAESVGCNLSHGMEGKTIQWKRAPAEIFRRRALFKITWEVNFLSFRRDDTDISEKSLEISSMTKR